jgi:sterol desaturase/sphingolipid hydroxylase (fatty acid hydroxylase superfamily)
VSLTDAAIFATFWGLFAVTALDASRRTRLWAKSGADWVLDVTGLLVQGVGIPALQAGFVYVGLARIAPGWESCLLLPEGAGFLLAFVAVDYLYYWNHRALHSARLWPLHQVHHTMTDLDVLGTSRNTLWTSFFIVYLWVHPALLFLLEHRSGYALGVAATVALDLWRHSALGPHPGGLLDRVMAPVLILPRDHAWHHGPGAGLGNYGGNLKLWDRLHGTLHPANEPPSRLGIPVEFGLARKLLWPFP